MRAEPGRRLVTLLRRMVLETRRSQRGVSVSLYVLVVTGALILTAGLVIDGGQQVTAASRAETVAADAARAAANAGAASEIAGTPDAGAAVSAARNYLAGTEGVTGTVEAANGIVTVRTRSSASTLFLSVIGINSVVGHGEATAHLVAAGGGR